MKKLSFIVTGRNDNYDGNFDDRLAIALSYNTKSLPDAEFIFVEWNPLPDRPLTCEKLKKVFGDRVRYYVADPKFHSRFCTIDGFLEYPPKNVGIRRSRGEFVGCINSDIIFSPELVEALKQPLDRQAVYRTTRVDIKCDYLNVEFPLPSSQVLTKNSGYMNASGDFLLLFRDVWGRSTGYCEQFPEQRLHKDSLMIHLLVDIGKMPVKNIGEITHWRHPSSWSNGFKRDKVGDIFWDFKKCGYKKNIPGWGLKGAKETNRDGIIWLS
jgi:hypothetical protein